jgi:hypothetical protein
MGKRGLNRPTRLGTRVDESAQRDKQVSMEELLCLYIYNCRGLLHVLLLRTVSCRQCVCSLLRFTKLAKAVSLPSLR